MRIAIAVLSLLHAFAHLPGFVGSWHLGAGVPHKTTILADRLDVGDVGIRAFGILWLLAAAAFLLVAAAAFTAVPWWPQVAVAAIAFSVALCLVHVPDTRYGVVLNLALIVLLAMR
jgi:hypothetical protein